MNKIISTLTALDENYFNTPVEEKITTIDELITYATEMKLPEKWVIFLNSEKEYYLGHDESSLQLTHKAYDIDKQNPPKDRCYYFAQCLGVSYETSGNYAEAEKYYKEAISINPSAFQSYTGLCVVYIAQGKYKAAKNKAEHVINHSPAGSTHYYIAKEMLGRIHMEKKQYPQANQTLLDIYEHAKGDVVYLEALAVSYVYINDIENAIKYYNDAASLCKEADYETYITYKINFLELLKPDKKLSSEDEMLLSLPFERMGIIETICWNRNTNSLLAQRYKNEYLNSVNTRNDSFNDNYILCLKGWSSSTPELSLGMSDDELKKGGGFFVHIDGIGIAIDPGLNYVENLHDNGLYIQDIDIVIVTHNHIDHNNDLEKIIDYSYQLDHHINYYLDMSTYDKYHVEINDIEQRSSSNCVKKLYNHANRKSSSVDIEIGETKLTIVNCPTKHDCEGSFGFKIRQENKILFGYTSDTAYTEDIGDFFSDCDILIANVSETNKDDITLKSLKSNHLGVYGTYKLLKNTKIKDHVICFLSEFWGGFSDIRLDIADILKSYLKDSKFEIVPLDIGMIYYIKDHSFLCHSCGQKTIEDKYTIAKIGKQTKHLFCLCDNCTY